MKWKCPQCLREHESEDNIKFVVCKGCLSSMEKEEEEEVDGKVSD